MFLKRTSAWTVLLIFSMGGCILPATASSRSFGMDSKGDKETIHEKILNQKRFVVYSSRRLTGECLPICVDETGNSPPFFAPTDTPTVQPTEPPTLEPTGGPTVTPTITLSEHPTDSPTNNPAAAPTSPPTSAPTLAPTAGPTLAPTLLPTGTPTQKPTAAPTNPPTLAPTAAPTNAPTNPPTLAPTAAPTNAPTNPPTLAPTGTPTSKPTYKCVQVRVEEPGQKIPVGLVFAIDSSGSMEVVSPTDPSRLRVQAAQNFVRKLQNGKDVVGVMSWNGCGAEGSYTRTCTTPFNSVALSNYMTASQFESWRGSNNRNNMRANPIQFVEPMSRDLTRISTAINSVNSDGLTNPNLGLRVAMVMLDQALAAGTLASTDEKVIVFLTDGRPRGALNGAFNDLTDIGTNCQNTASPAFEAMQKGYTIYTIGLGGGDIRPEDEVKLDWWSKCTGGTYMKATNAAALEGIFSDIYDKVEITVSYKTVCGEDPTIELTAQPTIAPTNKPTDQPTKAPTNKPTDKPTAAPSNPPTPLPTGAPTQKPTAAPTKAPTNPPTLSPTTAPTKAPTNPPTLAPTAAPTKAPSNPPTLAPTAAPTNAPTNPPTLAPTAAPTKAPTNPPTLAPTAAPTNAPTNPPTLAPTAAPTSKPTYECVQVRVEEPGQKIPVGLVFAIDSSGSMEVVSPTDPSRLRVQAAQNFVRKLQNGKDVVGVMSWNGCGAEGSYTRTCTTPFNSVALSNYMTASQFESWRGSNNRNNMRANPIQFVEPMSRDLTRISTAINSVNSDGLTNPNLGLRVAMAMLDQALAAGTLASTDEKVIVFLTDGRPRGALNGAFNDLTDIGTNCQNTASPAFEAMQKGYTIYTIGLGGGDIRPEDEVKLDQWSKCTGGTYMKATNAAALEGIFSDIYDKVEITVSYKTVCGDDPTNKSSQVPLPTPSPTNAPTPGPTRNPTTSPTNAPTPGPTRNPTTSPTNAPTPSPTRNPTPQPTNKCFTSGTCCDSNPNGCCAGLTCKSSSMWSSSKTCQ
ncbi:laminin G domain containing protein [Nitzschia inconspicua]|uniref:Laminin G domain containing protein n=1 Tax=Nitzschia inconspicua TaxID=303405 RepID=A0A9K3KBG0_9STRA|nr:laminin G domain containing protein [Nitzschia inconspicua]